MTTQKQINNFFKTTNNVKKININMDIYVLYFDGCCKKNPGPGASGSVLYKNNHEIWYDSTFSGEKVTNNIAEYYGLINGLQYLVNNNINYVTIRGDSLLIINQMTGKYKVKSNNIKELYNTAKSLESKLTNVTYEHVYREHNQRADELANEGINNKIIVSKIAEN